MASTAENVILVNDSDTISSIQSRLKKGQLMVVLDLSKGKRSPVWKIIGNVVDSLNPAKHFQFFACSKCFVAYNSRSSGTTSSLLQHVKSKQPELVKGKESDDDDSNSNSIPAKRQKINTSGIDGFLSLRNPLPLRRKEKLNDAILKFVVDRCLPFECSDCDSMGNLIYTAMNIDHLVKEEQEKVYKLPGESGYRKDRLPARFENMQKAVKKNILDRSKIEGGICRAGGVTTDFWTDKFRGREYMAVHYQFLDEDFKMNTQCLACVQITAVPLNSRAVATETASSTLRTATFGSEKYYRFEETAVPLCEENDFRKNAADEVKAYLAFRFTEGFSDNAVKSIEFPLIFWRQRGKQFPNLVHFARKYLSIPATSVPSEQIFATAGRMVTERRSLLSGKSVEMMVFCKKNIQFWNTQ